MTTLGDQLARIGLLLQDTDVSAAHRSLFVLQHQEELSRLARTSRFAQITWMRGVTGQALYTLPVSAASIVHVMYDAQVLRFATEQSLDTARGTNPRTRQWEQDAGEPTYWTTNRQAPNTIKIVPAPTRDGSAVPVAPPLPLFQSLDDNFVVFHYDDPSFEIGDAADTLPTLLDDEDLLVLRSVRALALQERPEQHLALVQACDEALALWSPKP